MHVYQMTSASLLFQLLHNQMYIFISIDTHSKEELFHDYVFGGYYIVLLYAQYMTLHNYLIY